MLKTGLHDLRLIPLFMILSLSLSSVAFGPLSVLAQESSQEITPPLGSNSTGSKIHYPCFSGNTNQTSHRMHNFGQHGNSTAFSFGKNGNHTGYRFGQYGNHTGFTPGQFGNRTGFKTMNPCIPQSSSHMSNINPPTQNMTSSGTSIPPWVKSNAKFWSAGQITDDDFVKAVQYLVSNGIIRL